MSFHKLSWRTAVTMLSDDRSGDLIALIFALVITIALIALLPI